MKPQHADDRQSQPVHYKWERLFTIRKIQLLAILFIVSSDFLGPLKAYQQWLLMRKGAQAPGLSPGGDHGSAEHGDRWCWMNLDQFPVSLPGKSLKFPGKWGGGHNFPKDLDSMDNLLNLDCPCWPSLPPQLSPSDVNIIGPPRSDCGRKGAACAAILSQSLTDQV